MALTDQDAIDVIVEAFYTDGRIPESASAVISVETAKGTFAQDAEIYGLWTPYPTTMIQLLDDTVGQSDLETVGVDAAEESRVEELWTGAKPTDEEWEKWMAIWIEHQSEKEDGTQFELSSLGDSKGRRAWILTTTRGYSFEGVSRQFVGLFESAEAAKAHMLKSGWIQ